MSAALALTLSLTFGAADFAAAREGATEIDSLKKTVTTLVGLCELGDEYEKRDCRNALKEKAKELRATKSFYLYLGPQDRGLRLEGARGSKTRLLWTPVIDAGNGLAITLSQPRKAVKGSVVVGTTPVDIVLAPGVLDSEVDRYLRTGQITVEVVGNFGKTWSIGKGSGRVQGVVFKASAIRFAHARTGKAIGETAQ